MRFTFRTIGGVSPPRPPSRPCVAVALVLALALALRLAFALRKGLVLDEFHSLFHAQRLLSAGGLDPRAFLETLRMDNHPPLSFLLIALARGVLGGAQLALRSPSIAIGMLELLAVLRLARGGRPATLALALLAASSLHLDFSTQARMYALLALCVTGLSVALLAYLERGRGRDRLLAGLWTLVGLHTHYFFLQYLVGLGLAAALAATLAAADEPALRARLRGLAPALALAGVLALPWYLTGSWTQLTHGLPPGGDDVGALGLAEAMVHLFYLNVRLGGPLLRPVFIACGGLVAALGAAGALALVRDRERATLGILCATTAFGVPLLAWLVASVFPRAGFTWHYVLPSAAPMAVLAAHALGRGPLRAARAAALGTSLAAALLLSVLNLASRGTEDFPGAVRRILAEHRPGDVVVSVEWQPALFPQGMPWDHYAPRLADDPPPRLAMRNYDVADPAALEAAQRVLLLRSKLPESQALMRRLRGAFEEVSVEGYGFGRWVHVFRR